MQQLTMTVDRQVEWWTSPSPRSKGRARRSCARWRSRCATSTSRSCAARRRSRARSPSATSSWPRWPRSATTCAASRRVTASSSRSRSRAASASAAAAGIRATAPAWPRARCMASASFGGDWGGRCRDVVRVPFADAMLVAAPQGVAPATLASASDNIPDGWRTVGRTRRAPRRRGADRRRRRAQHRALRRRAARALGAGRVVYADVDPAASQSRPRLGPRRWRGRRRAPTGVRRSRSTRAASMPACTPRCARPSREACARASGSTTSC